MYRDSFIVRDIFWREKQRRPPRPRAERKEQAGSKRERERARLPPHSYVYYIHHPAPLFMHEG